MTDRENTLLAPIGAAVDWLKTRGKTLRYLVFLLSLIYLFSTPFFWAREEAPAGPATDTQLAEYFWGYLDLVVTLLSGCFAVSVRRGVLVLCAPLAAVSMFLAIGADAAASPAMYVASDVTLGLFFAFTAGVIVCDIWRSRAVTLDTLLGAVCVYLLIAATWAFLYSLAELFVPGSVMLVAGNETDRILLRGRDYPLMLYFSFCTLTSVGYGDVIAASPGARMLSAWEAVVGQFYMAIMVARLVALYITRLQSNVAPVERDSA